MPATKKLNARKLIVFILAVVMLFFAREADPYAFAAGAALALLGEALRLWAAGHLTKNVALTTSGPYAHLKHPLYVGTFLVMMGLLAASIGRISLEEPNLYVLAVAFLVFVFYYFPYKRRVEAERMVRRFGEPAAHWIANVPEFFPRLRPYERADKKRWSAEQVVENSEEGVPLAILLGFVIISRGWWMVCLVGENAPDWILGQ